MNDADQPDSHPSVAELQADIERTREELGHTVEALSEKLDVKGQLKGTTDQVKANTTEFVSHTTHEAASRWPEIAVVAVTALAIAVIWRRY